MCGHCPESFGMTLTPLATDQRDRHLAIDKLRRELEERQEKARQERAQAYRERAAEAGLGKSRESFILAYGPDDMQDAILHMRGTIEPRQKEGDLYGEGQLDQQGTRSEPGEPAPGIGRAQGREDPAGETRLGDSSGREAGEEGPARQEPERDAEGHVGREPPPQPGRDIVWTYAARRFDEAIKGQVHNGLVKYDTVLRTFNGRDSYNDFLQEQADGVMYATQLYLEACTFVDLTVRAVQLLEAAVAIGKGAILTRSEQVIVRDETRQFLEEAKACLEKSGLSRSPNPSQT